jgi:prevent-host-death family protein
MKTLSVREMRAVLPHLDEVVAAAGEIVITRRGRPLARVLPARGRGAMPTHADLRASMPRLKRRSETLIRADRDAR